nr:PREDICTED: tripartite motif-containing protein 2-like [Latimeria chalumnae]|eukprot:XP_006002500.1 PREDICTED: tripartite motif-containing protein 2-like [Latimeria chalumnae]
MMSFSNSSMNSLFECMVCTERYDEKERRPKLLLCGHTFCTRCLNEISKEHLQVACNSKELKLPCPSCRQVTLLSSCISELIDNFAIIEFINSAKEVLEPQFYCKKHLDERFKFFCTSCQRLLCPSCAFHHVSQKLHEVMKAESAALRYKEKIHLALDYCKEKQKLLDKILQETIDEKQQLESLSMSLEHLINNATDMELLSENIVLRQLEEYAPQIYPPKPLDVRDLQNYTQWIKRNQSLSPPGIWCSPSPTEDFTTFSRFYREGDELLDDFFPNSIVEKFGNCRMGQGFLSSPLDVVVASGGHILVSDLGCGAIKIIDILGKSFSYFNDICDSHSDNQYIPAGISVTSLGYLIIIAKPEKQKVYVHARDGQVLFCLTLDWQYPYGVAVNSKGQILVTDKCVQGSLFIITVDWTNGDVLHLQKIEALQSPCFVACGQNDDIIITTINSVKKFNTNGLLLWSIGQEHKNYTFKQPMGVCVDSNGNILVSDYITNKIVLVSNEKRLLINVVTAGLKGPQGIALTANGLLLVADSQHKCIKLYKYKTTKHPCLQRTISN